jgi:transposase-like protein
MAEREPLIGAAEILVGETTYELSLSRTRGDLLYAEWRCPNCHKRFEVRTDSRERVEALEIGRNSIENHHLACRASDAGSSS